jgi:prolyl oligopeptidase
MLSFAPMKRIRRFLALLLSCAVTAAAAGTAGIAPPPPLAPPVVDTHWGVALADPYRFLENTADPAVAQWMRAQADATRVALDRIAGRAALLERIRQIDAAAGGSVTQIRRTSSDRWLFLRREPQDNQFRLYWRQGADGADSLLLDPEALGKRDGKSLAIMDFAPSPDGRLVAYSLQVGGSEIGTLHVIEVESGREVLAPIDRVRYPSVSWLDDGSGFFYSRLREGYEKLPPAERFSDRTRHFRALSGGDDRRVFSPSLNAELKLPGYASGHVMQVPGRPLAAAVVTLGVERHRLLFVAELADALKGTARWRKVVDLDDKVADLAFSGDWLYLKSAADAPRFKLLRLPLADPRIGRAETVLPAGPDVIVSLEAARDAVYVTRRRGAALELLRLHGTERVDAAVVPMPFEGSIAIVDAEPALDGVVLSLGGWTRVAKPYLLGKDGPPRRLALARDGAFDAPDDVEAREVLVRSHDGVLVPMSILSRKGLKLDGTNPAIVYGYGAYGNTEDPFFGPRLYAWLEQGGVFAVAHVRGGGVYGEHWRLAGFKATKPNTWKDAIAAAEWLIASGYTASSRIGVYGGSAGGILVGRAITERPDLFAAAVSAVGVHDTIRSETRPNGVANIPEYGTVKKEDEFHALRAMSSYEHVRAGVAYPGVMLVHGVNDIRVDVWQSSKFAARLAAAGRGGRPVLLRLDYDAGHGAGGTRRQQQERQADVWSFFLWQFGVPAFQPAALAGGAS